MRMTRMTWTNILDGGAQPSWENFSGAAHDSGSVHVLVLWRRWRATVGKRWMDRIFARCPPRRLIKLSGRPSACAQV